MALSTRGYAHAFLINAFFDGLRSVFSGKNSWEKTGQKGTYEKYKQTAYRLRRRGYIKITAGASDQKFLQLTKKGELELLLAKAWAPNHAPWDGKWRMIIFDVPREANKKRGRLRWLLKTRDFTKLQASVYITPYPLNREAISYLKQSGLIDYIRVGRLDELDDDKALIKHFKLTKQI